MTSKALILAMVIGAGIIVSKTISKKCTEQQEKKIYSALLAKGIIDLELHKKYAKKRKRI